jgi:hypothetical protein
MASPSSWIHSYIGAKSRLAENTQPTKTLGRGTGWAATTLWSGRLDRATEPSITQAGAPPKDSCRLSDTQLHCTDMRFGPTTATTSRGGLQSTLSRQSVGSDEGLEPDLKPTFGTSLWYRHRDPPGLWRGGAKHRLYQGSGRDSEIFDHLKTKDETCGPFSYPKAALLLDRIRLTPPSSFNLGCCDLEAHGRVAAGRPPGMLRTWRWQGRLGRWADDRMEREPGHIGRLVRISTGEQALDPS